MIRRLTLLVAATLLALILAAPAALAGGATQISGVAVLDEADICDSANVGADYALLMSGALEGCLYTFVNDEPQRLAQRDLSRDGNRALRWLVLG